jgi:hypothetical protein
LTATASKSVSGGRVFLLDDDLFLAGAKGHQASKEKRRA